MFLSSLWSHLYPRSYPTAANWRQMAISAWVSHTVKWNTSKITLTSFCKFLFFFPHCMPPPVQWMNFAARADTTWFEETIQVFMVKWLQSSRMVRPRTETRLEGMAPRTDPECLIAPDKSSILHNQILSKYFTKLCYNWMQDFKLGPSI